jgi:hypothetical protein
VRPGCYREPTRKNHAATAFEEEGRTDWDQSATPVDQREGRMVFFVFSIASQGQMCKKGGWETSQMDARSMEQGGCTFVRDVGCKVEEKGAPFNANSTEKGTLDRRNREDAASHKRNWKTRTFGNTGIWAAGGFWGFFPGPQSPVQRYHCGDPQAWKTRGQAPTIRDHSAQAAPMRTFCFNPSLQPPVQEGLTL